MIGEESLGKENSREDGNRADLRASKRGFAFYFAIADVRHLGRLYSYSKLIMWIKYHCNSGLLGRVKGQKCMPKLACCRCLVSGGLTNSVDGNNK